MKLRRATFAAGATSLLLWVLTSCGSEDDPDAVGTGGSGGSSVGPMGGGGGAGSSAAPAGIGGFAGGSSGAGGSAPSSAGTSGSGTGQSVAATFDTVKLVLGGGGGIMPCSAAPCHGVNGVAPPQKPLELPPNDDTKLYANLTSYVSSACGELKLVEPGNPDRSALVTVLKGPCGMTPRMPYGCSAEAGDCIPDDYIAAVAQWIASGAARQ